MIYNNRYQMPERVCRIIRGKYPIKQPNPERMSVTDLIAEPLIRTLYIEEWDKIVADYSDFLKATQGTALHAYYEQFTEEDDDAEHKLEDSFAGFPFILVGKADNYLPDGTILDVKQTKVYGPSYAIPKWTEQLNIYAWMRRHRNQPVDKLIVDVWYRDYDDKCKYYRNYPQCGYEEMELSLWSQEEALDYIQKQLANHRDNAHAKCSNAQRGIRYEVYKNDNKTPSKVESTYAASSAWMDKTLQEEANSKKKKVNKYKVVESDPVFCQRFCKARSVCSYCKGD